MLTIPNTVDYFGVKLSAKKIKTIVDIENIIRIKRRQKM